MSVTGAIYPPSFGSGSVLTSTSTGINWTTYQSTPDKTVEIEARLCNIETRLLILQPHFELHEKYPALKEAYDAYLTILALVNGPKNEE